MEKKYKELSATEKLQADCDLKATNIILQGLPSDVYSLINHHKVSKDLWERVQLQMQVNQQTHLAEFPQIDFGLAVPVLKQGDDPIDAFNKMMTFLFTVFTSCFPTINNQLRNSSNPRQQATIHDGRVTVQPVQRRQSSFAAAQGSGKVLNEEVLEFLADPRVVEAKAILIANLSSYESDVLSEIEVVCVEFGCHFEVELECEFTLSSLDVLQGFSFFLQIGLTLILATFDGFDVGLLGDDISEDDCDDDG
nr:hypothetical protein [Tanacetum cinerariifolium]